MLIESWPYTSAYCVSTDPIQFAQFQTAASSGCWFTRQTYQPLLLILFWHILLMAGLSSPRAICIMFHFRMLKKKNCLLGFICFLISLVLFCFRTRYAGISLALPMTLRYFFCFWSSSVYSLWLQKQCISLGYGIRRTLGVLMKLFRKDDSM